MRLGRAGSRRRRSEMHLETARRAGANDDCKMRSFSDQGIDHVEDLLGKNRLGSETASMIAHMRL
jgi:hypothetical protein